MSAYDLKERLAQAAIRKVDTEELPVMMNVTQVAESKEAASHAASIHGHNRGVRVNDLTLAVEELTVEEEKEDDELEKLTAKVSKRNALKEITNTTHE